MKKLMVTTLMLLCFVLTSFSQDTTKINLEKQKPKAVYQVGSAKVTVWENKGKDGTWKNYKIEKVYKKGDEWKTTNSFNDKELLELQAAIEKAISEENVKVKQISQSTTKNMNTGDSLYRLSVSFISIGAGTDKKAKQEYDKYIIQYEQKNNIKLSYENTPWGKEGEADYCFKLTELNKKQQADFIAGTKEVFKNSTTVRIKENTTCHKKK